MGTTPLTKQEVWEGPDGERFRAEMAAQDAAGIKGTGHPGDPIIGVKLVKPPAGFEWRSLGRWIDLRPSAQR